MAIVGVGVAAALQLMAFQGRAQAQAALRSQALSEAGQIMTHWLERTDIRPGVYSGQSASGIGWRVAVTDLTMHARQEKGSQTSSKRRISRSSARMPDLLGVEVCCTYRFLGRDKKLCLASERLADLERR